MRRADLTLTGRRLHLRPFTVTDITPRYLGWLSDPDVNRFSRRRDLPAETADSAARWLSTLPDTASVFAIHVAPAGHVGNIKVQRDLANKRADLSIVIGERAIWGQSIGSEALYLVTRHLFESEGLNRIDAGTCNPAFTRAVLNIGWRVEGTMRERIKLGGELHDYTVLAQLRAEFQRRPQYELQESAA